MNRVAVVIVIVLALAGVGFMLVYGWSSNNQQAENQMKGEEKVNVPAKKATVRNPADFSTTINNPYFTLRPGTKTVYEAKTEDGLERIEFYVTHETKKVMGIDAVVVWDRVWLAGDLIEDTKDWFAQDKEGNVWYFGEDTVELVQGKITSHHGAWEAGVNGAEPGIIMKANPKIGEIYREEYYRGEAEDMAEVLSLTESVVVPAGSYKNCLKTKNYTPLEPDAVENKFYCKEVGGVALEIDVDGGERVELTVQEYDAQPSPNILSTDEKKQTSTIPLPDTREELKPGITEAEAKSIALKRVPGKVTDIAIEQKFSKATYVVEVVPDKGPETDVIIDVNTGEVLAVET